MAEPQAAADLVGSLRDVIEEHRDCLIERIEPDFGLIDKLRENKTLSRIEIAEVRVQKTLYKRNSTILDYILAHDECDKFILALRDAHQTHLANFITANGQFKPEFGGDWPLTEQEISIIDGNHTTLVDLLDPFGLVHHLFSASVINNRQKDTISSKQTIHEKNETLLDILTRRSLFDYHKTISCLQASNQSHISQILDEGGVVVRVHANLQDDQTEDEIISRITELLNGRSQEDSSRILEVAQQRVIWAKKGQSIVIYIFCKTLLDLLDLKEMSIDGELKKHLCTMFTHIISRSQYVEVNVENLSTVVESNFEELFYRWNVEHLDATLSDEEFERCFSYFPDKTFVRAINDMDSQQLSARERIELLRQISTETSDGFENCAQALSFRKGDIMLILSPTDLGFRTKWWKVRHLGNLKTGYIQSKRVVIDYKDMSEKIRVKAADDTKTLRVIDAFSQTELVRGYKLKREDERMRFVSSATTVNDLPLELLNIILRSSCLLCTRQKSLLFCNTSANIVKFLASVSDYWHQIIKRRRFKKTVWRYLAGFYREISRDASISRNIRSYLVENMDLQAIRNKLRLADCLTDLQARLVNRQQIFVGDMKPNKLRDNSDAWHILRSTDKKRYSEFCRSLRQTDQKLVARVAENGGVVLKSEMQIRVASYRNTLTKQQLVECINNLHDKTRPRSHTTEKELNLLIDEDIEILNSALDRQAVVWLWYKSLNALKKLEKLIQCNTLMNLITSITKVPISTGVVHVKQCRVNLDGDIFKRKVDIFPTVTRFAVKLNVAMNHKMIGVAKLKNQIFAVYESDGYRIHVFEDKTPFHLLNAMEIDDISSLEDIASCRKKDCLYATDPNGQYVWKITIDANDNRFITKKWLSLIYKPRTVSVNSEGQLLMVRQDHLLQGIEMYDSECRLILDVQLHTDIKILRHAVETHTGNFIILHEQYEDVNRSAKIVSEVTRDGQMIIRTFAQTLTIPRYLSLYDDDKVFVVDEGFMSGKVILLQSGQVQSQMICPTGDNDDYITEPSRLCYDDETGQLIVLAEKFLNIYTINRY